MKPIVVGPLLGYESGNWYSVCILVDETEVAEAEVPNLSLSIDGVNFRFVHLEKVGQNLFLRAEFQPTIEATGRTITYRIIQDEAALQDLHHRSEWTFFLPGQAEQPLVAYASCNGFSSGKLARDTSQQYKMWETMLRMHETTPISLLLMGGDQVYADEIFESPCLPRLKEWCGLDEEAQNAAKVSPAMQAEISSFYDSLYIDRWSNEKMSLAFASIPSVMMWDDHDIFDGWGSYPKERHESDVYQEIFRQAARLFDLFQMRGAIQNRSRLNRQANHRSLVVEFRDYLILTLDNRTDRTIHTIMSDSHWSDVKNWMASCKNKTVKNLWVMAGVPVVYRSFAPVEKMFDITPWREESEDDVLDHWGSRHHAGERVKLIMLLMDYLDEHSQQMCKAILLSGDVHVGALGQITDRRRNLRITQVVSSGIVHPAPTWWEWKGIEVMTRDQPEPIGTGQVAVEMLTPTGGPEYLRTRNFATLKTGTDNKVWINWVCEEEKWKPFTAVD